MTRPARPPAFSRSPRPAGPFGRPVGGAPPALPDTPTGALARRIRARRVELGWSQADLAAAMGQSGHAWHQTTVAKTERAEREPRYTEVLALAVVLDSPVPDLLGLPGTSERGVVTADLVKVQALEQEQRLVRLRLEYVQRDLDDLESQRDEMQERLRGLAGSLETARKAHERTAQS